MIGSTLSHYRIVEKLGSGGMGDVYLAEDTELGRKVALKVLPTEMAESEERRARFKREARAIAALNHPNIVTVHSVEEFNGVHFMTMELVRGRTLSELLPKSGFALSKFLEIAIPLADAVAAAHEKGITHRDLKPDNVMVSNEGRVKVLDFGLAKSHAGLVPDAGDSNLATQHMTEEGRILGTVSYMSPEQAEGKPVDPRSDIFSLGVVFYEMLTGQRPFHGDTPASTLSAIIKDTPKSASDLRPSIPRDLARVLRRCLAKNPERRFQTCKDVRNELEELKEALSSGELQAAEVGAPARGRTSRFWVAVGVAVLVVGGAILGSLFWRGRGSANASVPRLTNPVQVTSAIGVEDLPTWSPEGGRIAFMSDQSGNWDIWVSQVGGGPAVNLTRDYKGLDADPSWSPDGKEIAFKSLREGGGCFVMSALGGTPRRVVSHPNMGPGIQQGGRSWIRRRPAWSPDSARLACPYSDEQSRPFVDIVTLATREAKRLPLQGEYEAMDLSWSPDGRFLAYVDAINWDAETTRLRIVGLSGNSIPLSDGKSEAWSPTWSPDGKSLFYVSNRGGSKDLWVQGLNEDAQPEGDPRAVTTGLGIQSASLLADGKRIAYSKGGHFANAWRVPILPDRAATWSDAQQLTFDQAYTEFVDVSPDGSILALNSNRSGSSDLWTLPAEGGEMQPLTSDEAPDWAPSWSPDGKEIVFYSSRTGNRDIFVMPSDGGPARQLTTDNYGDVVPRWSPDGKHIAYTSIRDGNFDIWTMSASGTEQKRLTEYGGPDNVADWSPDGQWIAFASADQEGRGHIWRIPATGGDPEQLTQRDSFLPRWSPDGRIIYFLGTQDDIWALALEGRKGRLVADLSGKPGRPGRFALATDGEYLYFTWEETQGDIWVMDVEWSE